MLKRTERRCCCCCSNGGSFLDMKYGCCCSAVAIPVEITFESCTLPSQWARSITEYMHLRICLEVVVQKSHPIPLFSNPIPLFGKHTLPGEDRFSMRCHIAGLDICGISLYQNRKWQHPCALVWVPPVGTSEPLLGALSLKPCCFYLTSIEPALCHSQF